MWLTHFWHSWSQFFIFAWDVTAGGILRTGVLICLVCAWTNGWVNNRYAGDLRCHCARYDVIVMWNHKFTPLWTGYACHWIYPDSPQYLRDQSCFLNIIQAHPADFHNFYGTISSRSATESQNVSSHHVVDFDDLMIEPRSTIMVSCNHYHVITTDLKIGSQYIIKCFRINQACSRAIIFIEWIYVTLMWIRDVMLNNMTVWSFWHTLDKVITFKKMHLKRPAKWRLFRVGLHVLTKIIQITKTVCIYCKGHTVICAKSQQTANYSNQGPDWQSRLSFKGTRLVISTYKH